jgi:hypothetical protein
MKKLSLYSAALVIALSTAANAACYADYKAKRDNPLQLHYGVIKLSDQACGGINPKQVIASRIAGEGWTLLNVLGTFDDAGLDRRRGNAGQYFLRY